MAKITRISPQRKQGFFNIFVDGRFAFGLDEETLYKEGLKADQEMSEEDVERLKGGVEFSKALNRSLSFLSYRPRSRVEVEKYLETKVAKRQADKSKGSELIRRVVEKLEALGYLNDEEFARWLIEQRLESRNPKGPVAIRQELLRKGIARSLADELLSESGFLVNQEKLITLLEKKGRFLKNLSFLERKKKLSDFLLRRGFSFDQVKSAVAEYLKER